jgi:hypothetical protein
MYGVFLLPSGVHSQWAACGRVHRTAPVTVQRLLLVCTTNSVLHLQQKCARCQAAGGFLKGGGRASVRLWCGINVEAVWGACSSTRIDDCQVVDGSTGGMAFTMGVQSTPRPACEAPVLCELVQSADAPWACAPCRSGSAGAGAAQAVDQQCFPAGEQQDTLFCNMLLPVAIGAGLPGGARSCHLDIFFALFFMLIAGTWATRSNEQQRRAWAVVVQLWGSTGNAGI